MTPPNPLREADRKADAMQAANFRAALVDERQQLATRLAKQHAEIARRTHQGQHSATRRLRSQMRSLEAELRYVDGLIRGLDRRFAHQSPS